MTNVASMEWWLVVLIALVAIVIVVNDSWRGYPLLWRANKRVRAERAAQRERERRLHEMTHRED